MDPLQVLPHRYPFLFIDRVTLCEPGKAAKGIKLVTRNEWFFPGHFPDQPIMPGVLIAEAIAQIAAFAAPQNAHPGKIGMIASMKEIQWRHPVVPGDCLELSFEVISSKGPFLKGRGKATVGERLVTSIAEMIIHSKSK
ncbi:beta-hydroxyacyl-ACP dehydratase [Xylanibacillus composti]|uniref:3-hydroxyacyl-[acyl-carrier-protein] dehydratase n=1 Tax=Xylanibacillus composti TaxID=1572762 RepID=A0A8J4H0V0_9BACL|nr:3-hydroxyacyl-ACP dehydratase FabZ [Xylanibacillus composti]MDT9727121.1 beta-hydroxyacyl-ACP dehydratase [Xylanibacillus composti]GIQ68867.1 3-hydroxyacyl-[acyl-carrier-protein] dehydratase FabZ [Xylanibacillus composti]